MRSCQYFRNLSKVNLERGQKVEVKIIWYQYKGAATRILYVKYECSSINTSEDIAQADIFVTERQIFFNHHLTLSLPMS